MLIVTWIDNLGHWVLSALLLLSLAGASALLLMLLLDSRRGSQHAWQHVR